MIFHSPNSNTGRLRLNIVLGAAVAVNLFCLYAYFCSTNSSSIRIKSVNIEVFHFIPFTVAVLQPTSSALQQLSMPKFDFVLSQKYPTFNFPPKLSSLTTHSIFPHRLHKSTSASLAREVSSNSVAIRDMK
jgi:hypothetical protein